MMPLTEQEIRAAFVNCTKGEARRLIEQGGVKINGEKATAGAAEVDVSDGTSIVLQVGKLKFAKLVAEK